MGRDAGQYASSHGPYGWPPSDESEDYDSADYEDNYQDYDWEDGDEYSEDKDSLEGFDLVEAEREYYALVSSIHYALF